MSGDWLHAPVKAIFLFVGDTWPRVGDFEQNAAGSAA
jgi:hypothetical protein